jgi:hypothetical protein
MKSLIKKLALVISLLFATSATGQPDAAAQLLLDAEFESGWMRAQAAMQAEIESQQVQAQVQAELDARVFIWCTCVSGMPVYAPKTWGQIRRESALRQEKVGGLSKQIAQKSNFSSDAIQQLANQVANTCKI